jgi:hypothetical protein
MLWLGCHKATLAPKGRVDRKTFLRPETVPQIIKAQARKVKPRAILLRTNQIIATPGKSDRHVMAMTMPKSV